MSQSPFQNLSPEPENAATDSPEFVPVRRLQSPAERFRAGEVARDDASLEVSPFDEPLGPAQSDAELEPPQFPVPAKPAKPDPFEQLPRAAEVRTRGRSGRARRGAESRRARRQIKQHAPHYHEKKPHSVSHKPINPAPQHEPPNEWDKAAQNSMARAALARKKSRVRRIVGRVVLASGVLLATWAGATALTAPQFEVKRVEISGLGATPQGQVEKLAEKLIGQNIIRARRAQTVQAVEAIPTVQSARLSRAWTWPPHLKLEVVERQPILQVGAGTTWWVADAQGVAFRRADRNDNGLEMLTSPQLQPQTGKPLPAAPWKRARQLEKVIAADNALVKAASGNENQPDFWDLRRVYLDENSAAALRISGQGALKQHGELLVRLGEEGWAAKLKQARTALDYFARTGRKASELDLVSGEHPRWKPKAEEPVVLAKSEDAPAD